MNALLIDAEETMPFEEERCPPPLATYKVHVTKNIT